MPAPGGTGCAALAVQELRSWWVSVSLVSDGHTQSLTPWLHLAGIWMFFSRFSMCHRFFSWRRTSEPFARPQGAAAAAAVSQLSRCSCCSSPAAVLDLKKSVLLLVGTGSSEALQCTGETRSLRALRWQGKGVGCCTHPREQKIPAELPALPTLLFHLPAGLVIIPPQADFSIFC